MKAIGLLGGMSWESSAHYYRLLNELVRERVGGLHSARCVLYSLDFADVEQLQTAGRWEEAGGIVAAGGRALESAGAEMILLCSNTMHKVADSIVAEVSIPLLHIADIVTERVQAVGLHRVGLLGTTFTMEQPFYRDRLEARGLTIVVPPLPDRQLVNRIIFEELCRGIMTQDSRSRYSEVIARLVNAGAEGVILGCTEIELLVHPTDSPVPIFPTTRLHAEAAVERALT